MDNRTLLESIEVNAGAFLSFRLAMEPVEPAQPGELWKNIIREGTVQDANVRLPNPAFDAWVQKSQVNLYGSNSAPWTLDAVPAGRFARSSWEVGAHYTQSIITGMKAWVYPDGSIRVLRLTEHLNRFIRDLKTMGSYPDISIETLREMIKQLLHMNRELIPHASDFANGKSLYIRLLSDIVSPGIRIAGNYDSRIEGLVTPVGTYMPAEIIEVVCAGVPRLVLPELGHAKSSTAYVAAAKWMQEFKRLKGAPPVSEVLFGDKQTGLLEGLSAGFGVIYKGGKNKPAHLVWPDHPSLLPSIVSDSVRILFKAQGGQVVRRKITLQDAQRADEMLGAGTALGVARVKVLHGAPVRNQVGQVLKHGPVIFDRSNIPITDVLQNVIAMYAEIITSGGDEMHEPFSQWMERV